MRNATIVRPDDPRCARAWREDQIGYEQSLLTEGEPALLVIGRRVTGTQLEAAGAVLARAGATMDVARAFQRGNAE